jgi:hypothetical protein
MLLSLSADCMGDMAGAEINFSNGFGEELMLVSICEMRGTERMIQADHPFRSTQTR